jgi:predicted transglutaminase-like cysteine proteinase
MRLLLCLTLLLLLFVPASVPVAGGAAPLSHGLLFGTQEVFSPDSSAFFKWHHMLRRFAAQRQGDEAFCKAGANCPPPDWSALVRSLGGLGPRAKVEAANRAINRYPYVSSWVNWREANRWETPYEFLRKGGECEDYAIAKYFLLREAGMPADDLRIVVVHDVRRGIDHAVAVAYVQGEALMLDNQSQAVVPTWSVRDYWPYYSINEQGWWRHHQLPARRDIPIG